MESFWNLVFWLWYKIQYRNHIKKIRGKNKNGKAIYKTI